MNVSLEMNGIYFIFKWTSKNCSLFTWKAHRKYSNCLFITIFICHIFK